jgi:hypothetical protein
MIRRLAEGWTIAMPPWARLASKATEAEKMAQPSHL